MYAAVFIVAAAFALMAIFRLLGLYFLEQRSPIAVVAFLVVGLITGWLAGRVMGGRDIGVAGEIVVGTIGALLGGLLFSVLVPNSDLNLIVAGFVALIGACLCITIVRAFPVRTSA